MYFYLFFYKMLIKQKQWKVQSKNWLNDEMWNLLDKRVHIKDNWSLLSVTCTYTDATFISCNHVYLTYQLLNFHSEKKMFNFNVLAFSVSVLHSGTAFSLSWRDVFTKLFCTHQQANTIRINNNNNSCEPVIYW